LQAVFTSTAPHRTAPHRTAPHRTAPHRLGIRNSLGKTMLCEKVSPQNDHKSSKTGADSPPHSE